jgi:hypothetical protein
MRHALPQHQLAEDLVLQPVLKSCLIHFAAAVACRARGEFDPDWNKPNKPNK